MTREPHPTRRRVLKATGGAALLGLAGCLGAPSGATTPSPTEGDHHEDDGHHEETTHGESGHHEEEGHSDHSPTEHESGHGHEHGEGVTPASDAATVRMTSSSSGEHFEPHVTWVNPGGTVTFVNESGAHTATAYHPDND
ncbi:MAG: hypothetical protein GWN07_03345, partial [Actinobacteria bacterium]|nr:hypothetical protein [Actinomycetota bacterium]NIU64563.1 hypothetical protein [Actinomycetota bacterium]NIW26465.1 hypothetical protein [Actinomycetota bacterium]NIX18917.1 hypothetical protein [Actinomycetota bacterium]